MCYIFIIYRKLNFLYLSAENNWQKDKSNCVTTALDYERKKSQQETDICLDQMWHWTITGFFLGGIA